VEAGDFAYLFYWHFYGGKGQKGKGKAIQFKCWTGP
jgi:hypothetical protein